MLAVLISLSLAVLSVFQTTQANSSAETAAFNADFASTKEADASNNAVTATYAQGQAEENLLLAETQGTEAAKQAEQAILAQATSERRALESQALAWTSQARELANQGDPITALALAVHANSIENPPPELHQTLYELAYEPGIRRQIFPPNGVKESVAFVASNNIVLSRTDSELVMWNIDTNEELQRFLDLGNTIAVSQDGQWLLGCCDKGLVLRNLTNNEERQLSEINSISGIGFDSDGETAYSVAPDLTISYWNVNTGEAFQQVDIDADCGRTRRESAFSDNGNRVLLQCGSFLFVVFDTKNEQEIGRFTVPNPVGDIDFTSDGRFAAIGWGLTVTIIDIEGGRIERHLLTNGVANTLTFLSDDRNLLINSDQIDIWDTQQRERIRRLRVPQISEQGIPRMGEDMIVSPNSRQLVYKEYLEDRFWLFDLSYGAERFRIHTPETEYGVSAVGFSDDNQLIVYEPRYNDEIICRDLKTGEVVNDCDIIPKTIGNDSPPSSPCAGYSSAFRSPSNQYKVCFESRNPELVSADEPLLWNVTEDIPIKYLERNRYLDDPLFSPDERILLLHTRASDAGDNIERSSLTFYLTEDGAKVLVLREYIDSVSDFAFSSDGNDLLMNNCHNTLVLGNDCNSSLILIRIDSLEELLNWVQKNRYVPDFTCAQRISYQIEPYCDSEDD